MPSKHAAYLEFLRQKIKLAAFTGFDVPLEEINPALKPHTREIVRWMLNGGRRACFASFGLHKTATQLECLRQIGMRRDRTGLRLQVLPYGVRQEFFREAAIRFTGDCAVDLRFIQRDSEVGDERTIYLTNYESVREGKITPSLFRATALDEASILRSYGSKTYQEFLPAFDKVEFKFVATATPDPNRYKELIHYAGYLGVMDTGQALTRFFQRDSEKAGNLTLYPHMEREFWLWVASWAIFITKPSDLGFDDDGYVLPALDVRWHEIPSDYSTAGEDKSGQGLLLPNVAMGLSAAAREKRDSMPRRIEKLLEIVRDHRGTSQVYGAVPETESRVFAGEAARAEQGELRGEEARVPRPLEALGRGESGPDDTTPASAPPEEPRQDDAAESGPLPRKQAARRRADARAQDPNVRPDTSAVRRDADGAGRTVCDLPEREALEQGKGQLPDRPLPYDGQGSRAAVYALQLGAGYVPGSPGPAGNSDALPDQVIVWCDLNDEQVAIEQALRSEACSFASLTGSQDIDERERLLKSWKAGGAEVFLSKPILYGCGVNLQQCHTMVFVGIGFKFQDFVQAIHRIHRFGQAQRCVVHIIHTEAEREIKAELQAKWRRHDQQQERMASLVRTYGLDHLSMHETLARTIGVERRVVAGERFTVAHNDAVLEAMEQPDNSVDLIVTSIPFGNHYEYAPSYNDFGHTEGNEHFWRQMDFLTPELFRILKPGRIAAIHVKDRVLFGNVTGLGRPSMDYFHEEAAMHLRKHGFHKLGMATITTDVVRENNQTYRLSYTEMCKDGTKMGFGCSEYLLVFFKPQTDLTRGYADTPVKRSKADYSLARWQIDAHDYWRSSGDRLLSAEELAAMGPGKLAKFFPQDSLRWVYDYARHVAIGEGLDARDALPREFACLQPGSPDPSVWTDVVRMRTLNGEQANRAVEKHICPLQFDIVDRAIERWSMRGELVYDPFHGLGTVGVRAIKLGRRAGGSELAADYFRDQVFYLQAAEREASMPSLFDALDPIEDAA